MKIFLLALLVAAAYAAPAETTEASELSLQFIELIKLRNALDELVRKTLEYVRWLLKRHSPYDFPPLPEQHLVDTDVDIKFSTSNVKLSNADAFTIDKISNDIPSLKSSFAVTVPKAHLEGDYVVSGIAFQKNVQGTGTFKVDINNLAQSGDLQFGIEDHSLQLEDIKLDYSLAGAQFDVQGLNIEGLSKEQVEDFLNKQLLAFLQDHKDETTKKTGDHVKVVVNKILKGHSLQDVIDFLKNLVVSTPDPPPFPTLLP